MWGELNNQVVVVGVIGLALGYFISWLNARRYIIEAKAVAEKKSAEDTKLALLEYKSSPELTALLDLRFRDGHQAGSAEAINQYKKSEGYEALFSVEHSKGKDVGIEEERNRWQLTYTPIIVSDDGFFSHTIETGYEMQIFYAGFPINDPLRRITEFHKKSKDENINKFLDIAEKAVDVAVTIASKNKIPVSVRKPRQEKKVEQSKK
jgi:hypothetical protein